MGMSEDDKRNCCLLEIQETEAKYYRTLEDIEKVGVALHPLLVLSSTPHPLLPTRASILMGLTLAPGPAAHLLALCVAGTVLSLSLWLLFTQAGHQHGICSGLHWAKLLMYTPFCRLGARLSYLCVPSPLRLLLPSAPHSVN